MQDFNKSCVISYKCIDQYLQNKLCYKQLGLELPYHSRSQ